MEHGHWKSQVLIAPEDYPDNFLHSDEFLSACCQTKLYCIFSYSNDKTVWLALREPREQAD